MSNSNNAGQLEIVVVGSDVLYPSRTESNITWSTLPIFRVSNTANFRGAASLAYIGGGFDVDEDGLVLATDAIVEESKKNFFARLLSTLYLRLKVLGMRVGVVNCAPA